VSIAPEHSALLYERRDDLQGSDSLSEIARRIAPGSTVLDLGAATGALGRRLLEAGCVVDGVEHDPDAAAQARSSYRRLAELDLDTADLREHFPPCAYDVVVCADVLEHLRDPGRVLDQVRDLLAAGGRALLSIPNVGYAGVLAGLLRGEFKYRPTGLLDETHLRFFTRRSLLELLRTHGYSALSVSSLRLDVQDSEFRDTGIDELPVPVLRAIVALPDALSYQFLVEAIPRPGEDAAAEPAPGPSEPRFTAQLYWSAGDAYADGSSAEVSGIIGEERQTLRFALPATVPPPVKLRLDPADRPGYLHLHDLRVVDARGETLWGWAGDPGAFAAVHELVHFHGPLGSTWLSTGEDPYLELPVPETALRSLAAGGEVRLTCSWPMSADYRLAARLLSEHEADWQAQRSVLLRRIDHGVAGVERISQELEARLGRLDRAVEALAGQQSSVVEGLLGLAHRLSAVEEGNALVRRVKKVGRGVARREFRFDAVPLVQAKLVDAARGEWESSGEDPSLLLRSHRSGFPRGWVLVDIELSLEGASFAPPCLYVDQGKGFTEGLKLTLPRPQSGRIEGMIRLPERVTGLRFDPQARPGRFTLGRISLREISPAEAGVRIATPTVRTLARDPRRLAGAVLKAAGTLRSGGLTALRQRLLEKTRPESPQAEYAEWRALFATLSDGDRAAIRERIEAFPRRPLLSILMPVYDTPEQYLRAAIDSVRAQLYADWQLCIADDASRAPHVRKLLERAVAEDNRIQVCFRETNGHISDASNSALALAQGEYVLLLDHDDEIEEHALYLFAEEILAHPDADILYSDEDKLDEQGRPYDPFFKPDWSPELFTAQNYVSHLSGFRTELVRRLGGFRRGFDGSQDYDLCLRAIPLSRPERIRHIPHVLYHWRAIGGSTAAAPEAKKYTEAAAQRALGEFLDAQHPGAKAEIGRIPTTYRVRWPIPEPAPLVTVIIPTRDGRALLQQCIESLKKTSYRPFEILVIDNQSRERDALYYFEELEGREIARVLRYDHPFNYSAINNFAVQHARGQLLALLNNDIEAIAPEWLTEMVSQAVRPEIGAVGAKLFYPDGTIQHAGVITGLGGVAGHSHKYLFRDAPGYFWRVHLPQNLSAVTAACLVIRREVYLQVGGLDEKSLGVAFNDVDFCLRVAEAGYRNVWTPYAELFHHESKSRGAEDTPEKQARFKSEIDYMKSRWGRRLLEDPYYSPNLTLDTENFAMAWPPRARRPWASG
jgi:GT2 family glycosyltransferase/2-polyprenyl-3-methyl-5-hydroxy-6-metoxy-1,4-benzoquinol methylase